MKKWPVWILWIAILLILSSCGREQVLPTIETMEEDGHMSILWEGRLYVPFCVVSKGDCGKPIGWLDGEPENIVSEYRDYPVEEWVASYLTMDGGAMLFREEHVTAFPDGLTPEYAWNEIPTIETLD